MEQQTTPDRHCVPIDVYVGEHDESSGSEGVESACAQGPHDTVGY